MSKEIISQYKAKVLVTKNLQEQIHLLHRVCPKSTEWSGLLVYQLLTGSLEDLSNVTIKAHGIYPMDFGDATFTSFEGNADWLKCFEQYPEIDPMNPQEGWYIGKLHSHHDMAK